MFLKTIGPKEEAPQGDRHLRRVFLLAILALLICALHSIAAMRNVSLGFDPARKMILKDCFKKICPQKTGYKKQADGQVFIPEL
jgi:hypothetical protein